MTELKLAFSYMRKQDKKPKDLLLDRNDIDSNLPFVSIQLPVFNEMYVMERLIDATVKMNYPLDRFEIQILDDSTDETLEISRRKAEEHRANGVNIEVVVRPDRKGYKAGALQYGMSKLKGEFIAIFDADFIPDPNFLRATIPHFENSKIGVVQTRWAHINKDYSLLTRVQAFFLDAHFTVEQGGRNRSGYFMNFNGTAGIWRKSTIEDAGGWQADTITEDLDLSYRAQMNGWQFIYLEDFHSPAELPADMQSFKSQQFRWIKGGAEVARKILPKMFNTKFPFSVKLNAFTHLLSSSVYIIIFLLIMLSIPVLIFKGNVISERQLKFSSIYLLSTLAIAIFYYISVRSNIKNKTTSYLEYFFMLIMFLVITMGLSFHNSFAALRGLFGEETPFIRTPKFNITSSKDNWLEKQYKEFKWDWNLFFEFLLAGYFLFGIGWAIYFRDFTLLPLHVMAFMGFSLIIYYTLAHSFVSKK